jgi:hypothetical protein
MEDIEVEGNKIELVFDAEETFQVEDEFQPKENKFKVESFQSDDCISK